MDLAARADHPSEFRAECREVGDLSVDFGQMDTGNPINGFAGLVCIVGKRKQLPHRIERKSEASAAANER